MDYHSSELWCILSVTYILGENVGEVVTEGKTKIIYHSLDHPGFVVLQSKDRITAGDGARAHDMKGKAEISTATTSAIFDLLKEAGVLLNVSC